MNKNQELLDWCAENIEEWDGEWTHIRSDFSQHPLFYSRKSWDLSGEQRWFRYGACGDWKCVDGDFTTDTPQVVSKEAWEEAVTKKKVSLPKICWLLVSTL